ncbi:MAG: LPS-assembly protein LptD [Chitinophagaceae bacterium]|nr:LPS-assembly protein LptD [Chitinophagaceae bacterium]
MVSLPAEKDSAKSTTLPLSKEQLDYSVSYQSLDSIVYDAAEKKLHLYEQAEIAYDDIKVKADYIYYHQDSSVMTALELKAGKPDSAAKPQITQGQESSTFTSLQYNFKSKRALVENAYSQYGEGFILSEQVKRNNDNSINGFRNIYTTCNAEVPHFGIAARKIKIIPNKVAVSGSANLVIEEIPTPLYLPFGLFPLKQGQRSGFKLPTYDMSENLGFGLREGGYYFAINEHVDLLALADIYALGTWRAGFVSTYMYRYRFNGSFSFNYAYNKIGETYEPGNQSNRNFWLVWNHSINSNVIPGSTFSANVNIGSSKYQVNNSYDANLYLNNNFSSSISYTKTWKNKPFNFSAALRHNQNTGTRLVQLTLPELNFSVNQIFPFQWRKDIIKPRWYEKITANYQVSVLNRLDFYDSVFNINNLKFSDFQNGIQHRVPVQASYNVLKYMNLSFNLNYSEFWYTQKNFKQYNFETDKLDTTKEVGFFTAREFDASASLSTRVYGTKVFKSGAIKGIRHVLTPSISLNYRPDFGSPFFNYYYNSFTDRNFTNSRLSYFDGALFGFPRDGKVGGVGLNLGNTLQMKIRSKKDTVNQTRKLNLIDGFNISSFYNLAVDSFRWSNVNFTYRTTLFETINLSGGMTYSPYMINKATGLRTPDYLIQNKSGLLRFETANLAVGGSLPLKKRNNAVNPNEEQSRAIGQNFAAYADFNIPWSLNLNYNVTVNKRFVVNSQKDTVTYTQDMNFFGDVNLTPKWKIGIRSGYDFALKQISFTSFDIYRDLHCWEMRLNLIPFGFRKSYNFALNVKSSVLQDLKLLRRRDFRDNL